MLDQGQADDKTSHTEHNRSRNVSRELFLEQQFNDLLLELNQEIQDEYFKCQEECNLLTEKHNFSASCKSKIGALPLRLYTKESSDQTGTISPPHIEIDFLMDSGATLTVLNYDAWIQQN